jgi:subtilisin family serine protease
MFAALLPREAIFELSEDINVVKIYPNDLLYTSTTFPVVPEEGIFKIKKIKKIRNVTTTYYTRELMGIDNSLKFTGSGVNVAVLDTGTTRIHEQAPNVIDFDSTMPQQRDENGHGTWVTTCISGKTGFYERLERENNKNAPVEGMSPDCNITSIKCLGWYIGTGSTAGIIEAVERAMNSNSKIISMSLGGSSDVKQPDDDPFHPIFQQAVGKGFIPIIAAGNEGPDAGTIGTPGIFREVLTIGAYNPLDGNISDFSSRGPTKWDEIKPDCVAPGQAIVSGTVGACDRSDGQPTRYAPLSGTSMSTPHVSGTVARMQQAHSETIAKDLTVGEIKQMLTQLGLEKTNTYGWGKITWQMYKEWMSTEYGVSI